MYFTLLKGIGFQRWVLPRIAFSNNRQIVSIGVQLADFHPIPGVPASVLGYFSFLFLISSIFVGISRMLKISPIPPGVFFDFKTSVSLLFLNLDPDWEYFSRVFQELLSWMIAVWTWDKFAPQRLEVIFERDFEFQFEA